MHGVACSPCSIVAPPASLSHPLSSHSRNTEVKLYCYLSPTSSQGLEAIAEVRAEAAMMVEAFEDEAYKERQENAELKRKVNEEQAGGEVVLEGEGSGEVSDTAGVVDASPVEGEESNGEQPGAKAAKKPRAKTTRTRKVKAKVNKEA